eukprot:CAMPEP_0114496722 /NCGR_PEP_ID=MMETSP0109-20121206/5924_1 /TAXON_ID=29199 /ORGANISM="Chlorarachnion reptans, Strain CCCM449" /LENGTH=144 /DNA_ID=CAMNT_0001674019 /DNA_START=98 /DNA_END=532 /DNA_ORIENTATION=-
MRFSISCGFHVRLITVGDKDGSGEISKVGSQLGRKKKIEKEIDECKSRKQIAELIFDAIDDDSSGEISFKEFKSQMGKGTLTDKYWKQLFDAYDSDGSGEISKEEFIKINLETAKHVSDKQYKDSALKLLVQARKVDAENKSKQ